MLFLFIYLAVAVYVAFAVHEPGQVSRLDFWCEIIACAITGLLWPIHYVVLLRNWRAE